MRFAALLATLAAAAATVVAGMTPSSRPEFDVKPIFFMPESAEVTVGMPESVPPRPNGVPDRNEGEPQARAGECSYQGKLYASGSYDCDPGLPTYWVCANGVWVFVGSCGGSTPVCVDACSGKTAAGGLIQSVYCAGAGC